MMKRYPKHPEGLRSAQPGSAGHIGTHSPSPMYRVAKPVRILSGGQTGVDRAALDAAMESGIPCGGWCPAGRLAEDGRIPDRYPVVELPGAGYRQRTLRNLSDADATVIFYKPPLSGGSFTTLEGCERASKPCLMIDITSSGMDGAVAELRAFIEQHEARVLNVAGPRASNCTQAGPFARAVLLLLQQIVHCFPKQCCLGHSGTRGQQIKQLRLIGRQIDALGVQFAWCHWLTLHDMSCNVNDRTEPIRYVLPAARPAALPASQSS